MDKMLDYGDIVKETCINSICDFYDRIVNNDEIN